MINKSINIINIIKYINSKYNLLRIILTDLILFYNDIYNYYVQYSSFLSYVKKTYPELFIIYKKTLKIYTIKYRKRKKCLQLPLNTTLVIGVKNYYKYKAIKIILTKIFSYDKIIFSYLLYLEQSIVKLINSMNKFRQIYSYSINIFFDDCNDYDNIIKYYQTDIDNAFYNIKRNYFTKNVANIMKL